MEAIRAIPAAQPAQRVKPLAWEASYSKYDGGKENFGTGIFGHWYGVKREKDRSWRVSHHVGAKPVEIGCLPDLDAAKAAAQADYDASIIAALEPAAQDVEEIAMAECKAFSAGYEAGEKAAAGGNELAMLRAERDTLKAEVERLREALTAWVGAADLQVSPQSRWSSCTCPECVAYRGAVTALRAETKGNA